MLTMPKTRDDYLSMRRRYQPDAVELVIVAESPPRSGKYFYDPEGKPSEPSFAAFMRQLHFSSTTKDKGPGLNRFRKAGWILVDATYQQVNRSDLKPAERDRIILGDYSKLCADLKKLIPNRSVSVILIKANVCRILKPRLEKDGFRVANGEIVIPFPKSRSAEKVCRTVQCGIESYRD